MNNKKKSLGQKIKKFRIQAGISQLKLETLIGASPGSISRIESGKVNPSKETIIDIAKALELETKEIAYLFEINLENTTELIKITNKLLLSKDISFILNETVNNLTLKMGYLASTIFLKKENKLYFSALTNSNISANTLKHIDIKPKEIFLDINNHTENIAVQAFIKNTPLHCYNTYEYTTPGISKIVADKIQKDTGDKSNLIYPLDINSNPFGFIVYVKKIRKDFSEDMKVLEVITKQISIAIFNAINN